MYRRIFLTGLPLLLAGCGEPEESGCLDVTGRMPLMSAPLYSDTVVVGQVGPGRERYAAIRHDDQYLWYEIPIANGGQGYLIVDPKIVRVRCEAPYGDHADRKRPSTIPWVDSGGTAPGDTGGAR